MTRTRVCTQYKELLSLVPAIAGLSGGTFRIPNSFMIMPLVPSNVVSPLWTDGRT